MKRSLIHIENCQIKSIEKARLLCALLDTMEKEFGIKEVMISFKNNFVCPDIDLTQLSNASDPMERLVGSVLIKCDIQVKGKNSAYKKINRTGPYQHQNCQARGLAMGK